MNIGKKKTGRVRKNDIELRKIYVSKLIELMFKGQLHCL